VRFAAYRAGAKLIDERTGRESDFSHRHGVVHTEILAPEGSAAWLRDRQALWNAVERLEKRADAQLAREINMALPHELAEGQRVQLVRDFVATHFVKRGMVADIAIHRPVTAKGDDPRNHHAHVTLTLRQATKEGLRAVKTREWNSDNLLCQWRRAWANHQNELLRSHGQQARVDHRTLVEQRHAAQSRGDILAAEVLDRLPELHVGPRATNAARRGFSPRSQDRSKGLRKQPRRDKAPAKRQTAPGFSPAPARREKALRLRVGHSRHQGNRLRVDRNLASVAAWHHAVPVDRQKASRFRPVRAGQGRPLRQRIIRYRDIDAGSRYQANRQRVDRNLAGIDRKITYWMDRAARERARHQLLIRQSYERRIPTRSQGTAGSRHAPTRTTPSPLVRQLEALLAGLFAHKRRHTARRLLLGRPFQPARRPAGRPRMGRHRAYTPS
jgi:hypothetical protein